MDDSPPDDRVRDLWNDYAWRVQAYATRHVDQHSAQEVVAETFLVAWRKLDTLPGDPLPWLLTVARNLVSNHRRAARRRRDAEAELVQLARAAPAAEATDVSVGDREALLSALSRLAHREREALLLTGWDGLAPAHAARVAGCSTAAFKMRLSRARRRLEALASDDDHGRSGVTPTSSRSAQPRRLA